MGINNNRIELWKADTMASVDYYNKWFMEFAPKAFREARLGIIQKVKDTIKLTQYFRQITSATILDNPETLSTLRMATAPPLAIDRLAGLSCSSSSFIKSIEHNKNTSHLRNRDEQAGKIVHVVREMLDKDIMPWLERNEMPKHRDVDRCASIVADRLSGSIADPIIRNEQEKRQLNAIAMHLANKGYSHIASSEIGNFMQMPKNSYTFHLNIPVKNSNGSIVNIPPDVVVASNDGRMPLLIECKSAGDFANTNKRRKEEAQKIAQLKATYGESVSYTLFLCGYFDTSYLGYEAAEGIDWVWEHRIDDLDKLGI